MTTEKRDLHGVEKPSTPEEPLRKTVLATFVSMCLWVLMICSIAGFFSFAHWTFDLFNHFRPNALIASVLFCYLAYLFNRRLLWLSVAITCLNGVVLVPALQRVDFVPELADTQEAGETITVVFANVLTSNDEYDKTIDVLTRDDPDIIALSEVNNRWVGALEQLEQTYPYTIPYPRSDNFGMAVYSKLPFNSALEPFGLYGIPLGKLDFGEYQLAIGHPVVPRSLANVQDNWAYIEALGEFAKESDKPTVIVGDLNSTVFSPAMDPLLTDGIQKVSTGLLSYTWPIFLPVLGLQLDHIFARGIPAAQGELLDEIGSDHYPVRVRFVLHN